MFKAIPWQLYPSNEVRYWVYIGLVGLGFLLAVITLVAQWVKPAPYGKHESQTENWGPVIPQRLGHILSDAIPGILLFTLVFSLYNDDVQSKGPINYVFLVLWLCHYIHRGLIHPLTMRYRSTTVPLGITLGGFFPNCIYHFMNADFIGSASYDSTYYYDPRFILGILLYVCGYITNRWADHKLKTLRQTKGEPGCTGYYIPYGGLFELISCPNYFGELVEWFGWALATWSLSGVVWMLFSMATFIPRSWHNHQWYKQQFENYPPNRRALIPYIY